LKPTSTFDSLLKYNSDPSGNITGTVGQGTPRYFSWDWTIPDNLTSGDYWIASTLRLGTDFDKVIGTVNNSVPHQWLADNGISVDGNVETVINEDPDGDGYTTWQEYVLGTLPKDKSSTFKAECFMGPNGPQIKCSSLSGREYDVLYCDDLSNTNWLPLRARMEGTGAELTAEDTENVPGRFYKILVRMQE
jgi:hypothetical protein